jgi:hypothetical protein
VKPVSAPMVRKPPPYQMPPKYSNASNFGDEQTFDPFDTSYVSTQKLTNGYQSTRAIVHENFYENGANGGAIAKPNKAMSLSIDDLTTSMIASMGPASPKLAAMFPNNQRAAYESQSVIAAEASAMTSMTSSFNDLSMTLNDASPDHSFSQITSAASVHATPTKQLDKQFLADLAKGIYKDDDTINNTQNYTMQSSKKEMTKTTDTLTSQSSSGSSPLRLGSGSPGKLTNAGRYEAAAYKSYDYTPNFLQKSSNQSHAHNLNDTNALVGQIWLEQAHKTANLAGAQSIYGNNANHNFVAIANRPASMIQNNTRSNYGTAFANTNQQAMGQSNIYNSIAGDVYSTIAGDLIYDTVSPTPSAQYGVMAHGVYNNNLHQPQQAPVIYDEVANEELLRPIRPAPMAPPGQQQAQPAQLSNQQIQRRLDKLALQQQQVTALMLELGDDDVTEQSATEALEAVNWDHTLAVRHYKVERLVR